MNVQDSRLSVLYGSNSYNDAKHTSKEIFESIKADIQNESFDVSDLHRVVKEKSRHSSRYTVCFTAKPKKRPKDVVERIVLTLENDAKQMSAESTDRKKIEKAIEEIKGAFYENQKFNVDKFDNYQEKKTSTIRGIKYKVDESIEERRSDTNLVGDYLEKKSPIITERESRVDEASFLDISYSISIKEEKNSGIDRDYLFGNQQVWNKFQKFENSITYKSEKGTIKGACCLGWGTASKRKLTGAHDLIIDFNSSTSTEKFPKKWLLKGVFDKDGNLGENDTTRMTLRALDPEKGALKTIIFTKCGSDTSSRRVMKVIEVEKLDENGTPKPCFSDDKGLLEKIEGFLLDFFQNNYTIECSLAPKPTFEDQGYVRV